VNYLVFLRYISIFNVSFTDDNGVAVKVLALIVDVFALNLGRNFLCPD
jgi:hypothetical protein